MHFKHYSHTIIVLILAASFSAVSAHAQSEDSTANNSLKDRAWALQFQIGSNFTLNAFQGAVISGKYHLSARTALRAGLSIGGDFLDDDRGSSYFVKDSLTNGSKFNNSRNSQSIQLNAQYLSYINPEEEINFFCGVGPVLSFSRGASEEDGNPSIVDTLASRLINEYKETTWSLGASAIAGVEWFATKRLSLHAEYGLAVRYVRNDRSEVRRSVPIASIIPPTRSTSDVVSKGWQFSGNTVKFGLSVYF